MTSDLVGIADAEDGRANGQPGLGPLRAAVSGMLEGDDEAFGNFYDLTAPLAYGLACHLADTAAEAEKLLNDAYLAAWMTARLRAPRAENAMGWILGLVRQHAGPA